MLINRYLIRYLLVATLFVTVVLTAIIWLTQSLRFLELIVNASAPVKAFMTLILLSLPKFIEVILPIALMAAVLFTYNRMIMDNELVVMRASGVSQRRLARPALTLAWIVTLILLAFGTWLSPTAHNKMQVLRKSLKTEYSTLLLREGIFNTVGDDLMVYIRERAPNGELRGIMIHDARDKDEEPSTITAQRGIMVVTETGDPQVIVYDGVRQQLSPDTGAVSRLNFQQYTIEVQNLKGPVPTRWREPDERNLIELLRPPVTERDIRYHGRFVAEAHKRLTAPFLTVAFTLVALISLLMGPFNRHGQSRRILAAIFAVIILEGAVLGLGSLSVQHYIFIPFMYAAVILPIVLGYFLLSSKSERLLQTSLPVLLRRMVGRADAEEGVGA